jgi:hypothetical protein
MTLREHLLTLLDAKVPMTALALVSATGSSLKSVTAALCEMRRVGLVERHGVYGRYAYTKRRSHAAHACELALLISGWRRD